LHRGMSLCIGSWLVVLQLFPAISMFGAPGGLVSQSPGIQQETSPRLAAQARTPTTQVYNQKLEELSRAADERTGDSGSQDYRVGPDDLLDVSVFEAPDLNRTLRVSAEGEILLPLLGTVRAVGLTPSALARVLEELLRKSYMKDPHVGIFLREMQSHPVSVFGAVAKPGVYQIRGAKSVVEVLSMAQGLAPDAGDKVIIERQGEALTSQTGDAAQSAAAGNGPEQASVNAQIPGGTKLLGDKVVEIQLRELLDSGDPGRNVLVYPGDVVKVTRASVVYVVGEVRKPGGFQLNTNENSSVLQSVALAEGLTRTSAPGRSRVIRTDRVTGERTEIAIDIRQILAGKAPDQLLQPKDIVFVPNSAGKIALYRGLESALGVGSGLLIYRAP